MRLFYRTSFVLSTLALVLPQLASASVNPNFLVPDQALTDTKSMSFVQLAEFLAKKGSLTYYYAPDIDGVTKTAAEIIQRVSTTYGISPKFLLVLLQREQSLVEDKTPKQGQYDWAMGYAVCDSCKTDSPEVLAFKGFANQLEGAARQIRNRYLPDLSSKGTTISGIGPGIAKTIDGTTVTPENKITSILYTYTPHLQGNLNFAKIWQSWFSLSYPDGTVVQVAGSKDKWLIQNGQRRLFASKRVFLSRFQDKVILPVTQADLEKYPEGSAIHYANYSLLSDAEEKVYLIDGDSKRLITSKEVFRKLGFNPDEVEDADAEDLASYADGTPIDGKSAYPEGALVQDKKSGGVYWVQDGVKHPIYAKEIMVARFPGKAISKASADQLAQYEDGDPVNFADGTLVGTKTDKAVSVIEHGVRRPIASEDVFTKFGWKWQNVVWTSTSVLNGIALGEPITIDATALASAQ